MSREESETRRLREKREANATQSECFCAMWVGWNLFKSLHKIKNQDDVNQFDETYQLLRFTIKFFFISAQN